MKKNETKQGKAKKVTRPAAENKKSESAAAAPAVKNESESAAAAPAVVETAATPSVLSEAVEELDKAAKNAADIRAYKHAEKKAEAAEQAAERAADKVTTADAHLHEWIDRKETAKAERDEAGKRYQAAEKKGDLQEMKAAEKANAAAMAEMNKAQAKINMYDNQITKYTLEAEAAKADAEIKRNEANRLKAASEQAQQEEAERERTISEELRGDVKRAAAEYLKAAEKNAAAKVIKANAIEAAAIAEKNEERRRLDVATARTLQGEQTADDTAVLAIAAATDNAAHIISTAADIMKGIMQAPAYRQAYKAFKEEETSLSKACKDIKAAWSNVVKIFDAAGVKIERENVTPKLFGVEMVSPFLLVPTAKGCKVGTVTREKVKEVRAWSADKAVRLLILNHVLRQAAQGKEGQAAAARQCELLIAACTAIAAAEAAAAAAKSAQGRKAAAAKALYNAASVIGQEQAAARLIETTETATAATETATAAKGAAGKAKQATERNAAKHQQAAKQQKTA